MGEGAEIRSGLCRCGGVDFILNALDLMSELLFT